VANEVRATNEGRHQQREAIHRDMAAVTSQHDADEILADLRAATIPATRIMDIRQVIELPQLGNRLTRTTLPDGHVVRMQPMAVDVPGARTELGFPPKYGADTARVLTEAGYSADEVDALRSKGVVA